MAEQKVFLATTKTGHDVYIGKETYEHMKAHPDVDINHVKEAISLNDSYAGPFQIGSVDVGHVVGKDNCITVEKDDARVQMAYRWGRDGRTPIILNDKAEAVDTSLVTVGICKDDDGKDTMFTAFYGQLAPKEPWDKSLSDKQKAESEQFWKTHALIVSEDAINWSRTYSYDELSEEIQEQLTPCLGTLEFSVDDPDIDYFVYENIARSINEAMEVSSDLVAEENNIIAGYLDAIRDSGLWEQDIFVDSFVIDSVYNYSLLPNNLQKQPAVALAALGISNFAVYDPLPAIEFDQIQFLHPDITADTEFIGMCVALYSANHKRDFDILIETGVLPSLKDIPLDVWGEWAIDPDSIGAEVFDLNPALADNKDFLLENIPFMMSAEIIENPWEVLYEHDCVSDKDFVLKLADLCKEMTDPESGAHEDIDEFVEMASETFAEEPPFFGVADFTTLKSDIDTAYNAPENAGAKDNLQVSSHGNVAPPSDNVGDKR